MLEIDCKNRTFNERETETETEKTAVTFDLRMPCVTYLLCMMITALMTMWAVW